MGLNGYIVTCPKCHFAGNGSEFSPSCADECCCPKCDECFIVDTDADDSGEVEKEPTAA